MKSITQEHNFGCGVASMAYVSHSSYEAILSHLNVVQAEQRGFYCSELVDCLEKLGLRYEWKYVTPKLLGMIHEKGNIIYLKRSKLYPSGHYMAMSEHGWMDSWINFDEDQDISNAQSGYIRELPYQPSYVIRPVRFSLR